MRKTIAHKIIFLFGAVMIMCPSCAQPFHDVYDLWFVNRELTQSEVESKNTYILSVPVYIQTQKNCCGLVALKMVRDYWRELPIITKTIDVGPCDKSGLSGRELANIAINYGLKTYVYSGNINDVRRHLLQTRPIIILVEYNNYKHFLVITGFDGTTKYIVNDPARGRCYLSTKDMLERWKNTNFFSMLVVPKEKISQ